ncbi:uncharacterized protein Z520_02670 [Fonsecaea multimorphosa CBS 102226]|uniref:Phosphoglucomutase n=1 Tax=Fonsecaea multimorphosa CBS 102226 TaxID=1442371 RepID=A0A0D2K5M6_9EURO|nr:uncharacterized protein Z520_02670 [Fonsecaea multimorphosa CBS 102226]KIY01118.1 hypothetical protein Z520_02670 [Fonsecaea multimorphosa CBS 102226]OAL28739.1 hypothetical protein AYO22_02604 [Fonsecaea multimorphosa]
MDTLASHLTYEPVPLRFGTSGRRGKVVDLTQLEIYTNVVAEIDYLQELPPSKGGVRRGDDFYLAYDLRPSSTGFVKGQRGGGICQAVVAALQDRGMNPVNLGAIPTPALACYAFQRSKGSIMVTGSHIPFDRNGYKLNTSKGELLKEDEKPINAAVEAMREKILNGPYSTSLFDDWGNLRNGTAELPPSYAYGGESYIQRYLDFFQGETLDGARILVYQHSAVGRDLLVELLQKLGAQVTAAGRSDVFVPIDTEAIDKAQMDNLQKLYVANGGSFDAIVSTDGDSDRPLLVGPDSGNTLSFFGGDVLGMITADFLGADSVVVPISTNDAIDRGRLASVLQPKTQIGSPYVISGMQTVAAAGQRRRICGWEANGGFLTGSDIQRKDRVLVALPTRDAVLPLLCALFAARDRKMTLSQLFSTLPQRFSRAAVIRDIPRAVSAQIIQRFSVGNPQVREVNYDGASSTSAAATGSEGNPMPLDDSQANQLQNIRNELQAVFGEQAGFSTIARLNYTDGVRIIFTNGDVAHFRPSGNADELRIYAVADTQRRADEIASQAVAEPDGLLRQLERKALRYNTRT